MRYIKFKVELDCNTEFTKNEPRFIEVVVECEETDDYDIVIQKINQAFVDQQFPQRVVGAVQEIINSEVISPTL